MALQGAPDQHKFLLGEPETNAQKRAAERAVNLLRKIGTGQVEIVREGEREAFSDKLASEIREHDWLLQGEEEEQLRVQSGN